jgi:hypothetical protein
MGLRHLLSNRVPREPFPEDPVARLQYVYDKVLGYVAQDSTVHEVELLLYPWLRAAFPAGPDSIPGPVPASRAMLTSSPGGSASCCDVDVGEAGHLDSSGSVSGHIRSARFLTAGARPLLHAGCTPVGRVRKADAIAWEQDQRERLRLGERIDPRRGQVPLPVVPADWLGSRSSVKRRTRESDAAPWRNYLRPRFGNQPVASIKAANVSGWLGSLVAHGLAPSTATRTLATLWSILARSTTWCSSSIAGVQVRCRTTGCSTRRAAGGA